MEENPAPKDTKIKTDDAPLAEENKKSETKKALSVIALVFGILGLVSCVSGFFALVCCLVGIIVGIVALVKKHQKGMAIAGLVCGAVGIIPAVLFSVVWGAGLSMLSGLGGVADFSSDPTKYCEQNPDSILCDEDADIKINGQPIDTGKKDTDTDTNTNTNKNTGSDTKKDSSSNKNTSKTGSGWTLEYLKEVAKEKGVSYAEIPEGYKTAFSDFEVCLSDAGIVVSSWEEFENLSEDSDDMSLDQAMGLLNCAMELQEATEGLDDGELDLDL